MTCMCAFAQSTAMATTQLTRVARRSALRHEDADACQSDNNSQRKLRMRWVVVTDNNGRRQLRIQWEGAMGS